jgi:hypothetical protein
MTVKGQRDVGFLARNVGSMAGFLEEPDTRFASRISRLGRECRKCRVLVAGERAARNSRRIANYGLDPLNPLIIRYLHDFAS